MRRLLVAAFVTVLVGFGAYFAVGAWRSDGPNARAPATESWHIELRPVDEAGPLACGRAPYRACTRNGTIARDAASTR